MAKVAQLTSSGILISESYDKWEIRQLFREEDIQKHDLHTASMESFSLSFGYKGQVELCPMSLLEVKGHSDLITETDSSQMVS